ncbi:hypothetical protein ACI2KT_35665 [Ensifer adhaerens]|uniref:hypothetical protein n=1 Tax=Ensifer adhaerens TaxID=106592 RepID=UPI00384FE1D0
MTVFGALLQIGDPMFCVARSVVILLLMLSVPTYASDLKKYALVFGNTTTGSGGGSSNCPKLGRQMATALSRAGYHVLSAFDGTSIALRSKMIEFETELATPPQIAFVYICGKAKMSRGRPFFIPASGDTEVEPQRLETHGIVLNAFRNLSRYAGGVLLADLAMDPGEYSGIDLGFEKGINDAIAAVEGRSSDVGALGEAFLSSWGGHEIDWVTVNTALNASADQNPAGRAFAYISPAPRALDDTPPLIIGKTPVPTKRPDVGSAKSKQEPQRAKGRIKKVHKKNSPRSQAATFWDRYFRNDKSKINE